MLCNLIGCELCYSLHTECDCDDPYLSTFIASTDYFDNSIDPDEALDAYLLAKKSTEGNEQVLLLNDVSFIATQQWLLNNTLLELKVSLLTDGQEEPVALMQLDNIRYVVINGHHRLATLLDSNKYTVRAKVFQYV